MNLIRKIGFGLVLILATVAIAQADIVSNESAPNFKLMDTKGQEHSLSDYKGKFVVLEWVNYDCPFVQKHYGSQNMQGLQKKFTEQGVVWLSINSSADGKQGNYSAEEINQMMNNSQAAPTAYLFDAHGEVGRLYGAKTTPHMFVINPSGVLIYQGAIDDNDSFDPAVIPNSKNYVSAALESALSGQPVEVAATKSYGCSVKY